MIQVKKLLMQNFVSNATLTVSTNPLQNKVIYPALSNFISKNTTFTVQANGSSDFTALTNALAYIGNKWSDGKVIIHLETGPFTEVAINLGLENCNISTVQIEGEGISNTTLNLTDTTDHTPKIVNLG